MKPRRVLVVGCVVSQRRIAHILPECQVIRYEDGMMPDPDVIVICCDDNDLIGECFSVVWPYKHSQLPVYRLIRKSSSIGDYQTKDPFSLIGKDHNWPAWMREIHLSDIRMELSLGDRTPQSHPTLF